MQAPSYDLQPTSLAVVRKLFVEYHQYKSVSKAATYCFGVFEAGNPVAAYVWQPPPPGAARAVCPEAPQGVLALSRMVAVPRELRLLRHISTPLRRQMKHLLDRTRWPVLITYSDEGCGHLGHVYKCSGWIPSVRSTRAVYVDADGRRCSSYSNGRSGTRALVSAGRTVIQRWEHRACAVGTAHAWMEMHGWVKSPIPNKVWRSGNAAYTYVRR